MAPVNKAKAAGVSASSFFDLKAELAKQEQEFAKNKAAGKTAVAGGVRRPDKKPTIWARANKGVKERGARDVELEEISRPTLESARAALERKAVIYEKLRKGKSGGLSDGQYDALLVDFDQKAVNGHYESDSDDVDESLTVPRPPENDEDDPVIEYEDEFGRIRQARRSEVPRHLLPRSDDVGAEIDDEVDVIRNPVNYFPVYEPSEERIKEVEEAFSEANNPLNAHYDASREVRAKGAGFYQFSGDEETRKQQMEELKAARVETEKSRQEAGAADIRPGEIEGMREESGLQSRAMEKRKRELEERRKMLEAKRRKLNGGNASLSGVATENLEGPAIQPIPSVASRAEDGQQKLKEQSRQLSKGAPQDAADAFLFQLEQEMLNKK